MAARLTVLALAVVLAGFGAIARHDSEECGAAGRFFFTVGGGQQRHVSDTEIDRFTDACRGSHLLALGGLVLARRHQAHGALRLSDEAIRREPDNFEGWVALSRALKDRHRDAAAARALRRALALNPRFGRRPG